MVHQVQKEDVQLDQLLRQVIGDLELAFGTLANVLYQNQLASPIAPEQNSVSFKTSRFTPGRLRMSTCFTCRKLLAGSLLVAP